MEFNAGFTLIGEDQDGEDETDDLTPVPPGSVFSLDQDLYQEGDQAWGRGDGPIGEAHGAVVATKRGRAMCAITFAIDESDVIVAQGLLPLQGRKLGSGSLAVTGGTGAFDKVSGRVDMETRNPKRWSFVL
jgi:hypothetical protein